ncbi:MAG: acyl-CoA dehydrogenase family protein [Myxococcales bacterium]|jgi:alkylation response protein AidB-like acyl-CoA dehydrogenase
MDFELNAEQKLLVDNVSNFVKKDSPLSRFREQRDVDPGWSKAVWAQMGELGWLALPFSEEDGGLGMGFIDVALVLERLGTTLVPEPIIPSVVLGGTALARAGNAAQKEQLLAPMMEGQATLALAYAERDARHDLKRVATRAEKSGSGYTLSGEKVWVLGGDSADHLIVSARTGGEVRDAGGISLFAVDPKAEGVKVQPLKTMDGRRAAHVTFDGAKLPGDALLGEEGAAAPALDEALDLGAAAACAEGAGLLDAAFQMTRDYLDERVQFGVKIGSFQALQHRAVDMFIELQLAKATMLLAALKADEDPEERRRGVSIAKAQLGESGRFITAQAIQLHGGIGVTDEHDIGLYFKRMNVLNALFGDEAHHLERFSGLPRFDQSAS